MWLFIARLTVYSRSEPHKRLKKFLNPAFVVKYVDSMDEKFCECVKNVMTQWSTQLATHATEKSLQKKQAPEVKVDLMDTLHRMALDM